MDSGTLLMDRCLDDDRLPGHAALCLQLFSATPANKSVAITPSAVASATSRLSSLSLGQVSEELLGLFFAGLTAPRDLASFELVCRSWNLTAASCPDQWRQPAVQQFPLIAVLHTACSPQRTMSWKQLHQQQVEGRAQGRRGRPSPDVSFRRRRNRSSYMVGLELVRVADGCSLGSCLHELDPFAPTPLVQMDITPHEKVVWRHNDGLGIRLFIYRKRDGQIYVLNNEDDAFGELEFLETLEDSALGGMAAPGQVVDCEWVLTPACGNLFACWVEVFKCMPSENIDETEAGEIFLVDEWQRITIGRITIRIDDPDPDHGGVKQEAGLSTIDEVIETLEGWQYLNGWM